MKPILKFVVCATAIATMIPVTAVAQDSRNQGYLLDRDGEIVISPTTGLCWRDSDWTPARATESCDRTNRPVAYAPTIAPPPAPVERPAVIAAVVPPPEPPKPVPQKVSFAADALFAFDKSDLKPEGKAMLDDFAQQLRGTTYDMILATGHTDRFGSVDYNQKLSLRRANTVKDYLISKDISGARIDADGKGKQQPVTKPGECAGAMSTKVIACLQPDRRVDIEMHGTKTIVVTQ